MWPCLRPDPGTLIGAVLLRAAIALYNALAGGKDSPSGVAEPAFGKAMGITFVTTLVNLVASFVIGLVVGTGAVATGAANTSGGQQGMNLVAQAISFPISLLIMAGMLTAMLPTTFGRAILVTLCYMVIVLIIVAVIVGGLIAVGIGMGGFGR